MVRERVCAKKIEEGRKYTMEETYSKKKKESDAATSRLWIACPW